ncbi:MAG: probable O-methyltransferase [Leptospirillum rubarum]|uniref:Probable O-methyltransferase n=1 Tax=Leptospirillum sp. Group II '5-way CG' TaxID=419541 RepID=B6AS66_9BACT|nr:MAG: probable O-methyltransferase [Leptospirillum rubarum]EDZ38316.1 MAG: Probable O-methyltransferase [Leptospirillum sp. Group II '5-way CG']
MQDFTRLSPPLVLDKILEETATCGFSMGSEIMVGCLLRTLAASKSKARFLELGTGTGLSTAWILDGMDCDSTLLTVDNDEKCLSIARCHLSHDPRLTVVLDDGEDFIRDLNRSRQRFDFIFADTWPGKYRLLEETLTLLAPSGFYVIDDMLPQSNWPKGHGEKVSALIENLECRKDLFLTKISMGSGVIVCTKIEAGVS